MKNNKAIKTSVLKKVGAVALGLGIVGASVFAGASLFPKKVGVPYSVPYPVPYPVVEYQIVPGETIIEYVDVEKPVEVLIDNGNLDLVLNFIYNNNDMEFITQDLDEDEINEIVERIVLLEDVASQVKSFVYSNLAKELEKQLDYDRRDVSKIKIDEDTIKFINNECDFKYEEFLVELEVEYRYDKVYETKKVEIEFYNNRVRNITFLD